MWYGIVSDTHGFLDPALVEIFRERGVGGIVHAGDLGPGDMLGPLRDVAPVLAVRGNIDPSHGPEALPLEAVEVWGGRRVGALHIAGSSRRPNRAARAWIERGALDILVVGHSHIQDLGRVGGALWINPGAAGHAGFHRERTAALVWLVEGEEVRMERVVLGPRGRSHRGGAGRHSVD